MSNLLIEQPISLEEVVTAALLADAPLNDYFESRGRDLEEALFRPGRALDDTDDADVLDASTAKPFIVMQLNAEQGSFPVYSGFTLELFDAPANRYNEIRKMANLLVHALDHQDLPSTAAGYRMWVRTDVISVGSPTTDPEYLCDTLPVRFQVYGA